MERRRDGELRWYSADVSLLLHGGRCQPLASSIVACHSEWHTPLPPSNTSWPFGCWWHLRRGFLPIYPLSALTTTRTSKSVSWHNRTVWLAASVANLYDIWNDVLLPLRGAVAAGDALRLLPIHPVPRAAAAAPQSIPVPPVLRDAITGWLNGVDTPDGEMMSAVPISLFPSRHALLEALDVDVPSHEDEGVPGLTCFRSSRWVGLSAVFSSEKGSRIVDGDPARQHISNQLKEAMARRWQLVPYSREVLHAIAPPPQLLLAGGGMLLPLVSYAHVPSRAMLHARATWRHVMPMQWGGLLGGCRPRLLLILRKHSRRIAEGERIAEIAESVGFDTAVLVAEESPADEQAHAARYADVLVGVHGQGLSWAVFMDGVGMPRCRFVVELRHYGRRLRGIHNVYEQLAADQRLRYLGVPPHDVTFDVSLLPAARVARAKLRLARKGFPHGMAEFDAQILHYDRTVMRYVLRHVHREVASCACRQIPPSAALWEQELSGVVGE